MARRVWIAGVAAAAMAGASPAETVPPAPVPVPAQALAPATSPVPAPVLFRRDTPLVLMATKEVSTADMTPGTLFKLRVHEAVTVNGRTVTLVGATALDRVDSAVDPGGLGKSGRMTARLLDIVLGAAEIPIDGSVCAKGTGAGSAGDDLLFVNGGFWMVILVWLGRGSGFASLSSSTDRGWAGNCIEILCRTPKAITENNGI